MSGSGSKLLRWLLVAGGVVALWVLWPRDPEEMRVEKARSGGGAVGREVVPEAGRGAGHPDARSFGSEAISAEREPEVLLGFFQILRERHGAFPEGEGNAQFMRALAGNNPSGLVVFPVGHRRLDANGALLDAWGTPFAFHPVSRQYLEIRSAGADREMYTADDLVVPKRPDESR